MARPGRPKKSEIKNEIKNVLLDNNCFADFSWWVSTLYRYKVEGEEEYDELPDFGVLGVIKNIEMGDYLIANCFLAARQVMLLLAEKEGVVPRFSDHIPDDAEIYSMHEACSYKGPAYDRLVETAYFNGICKKYGFDLYDKYNWSCDKHDKRIINSSWSELDKAVLCKISSNYYYFERNMADKISKLIEEGGNPEEIEEIMSKCDDVDSILCLASERIIKLLARYYKLPKSFRKKNSQIAKMAGKLSLEHNKVNTNLNGNEYAYAESDNIELANGVILSFSLTKGFWDADGYEGYSGTYYLHDPAKLSFDIDTVFFMEECYELSKKFKHELVAVEKKAKRYLKNLKERKKERLKIKLFKEEGIEYVPKSKSSQTRVS